jgi:hypothetical protein
MRKLKNGLSLLVEEKNVSEWAKNTFKGRNHARIRNCDLSGLGWWVFSIDIPMTIFDCDIILSKGIFLVLMDCINDIFSSAAVFVIFFEITLALLRNRMSLRNYTPHYIIPTLLRNYYLITS